MDVLVDQPGHVVVREDRGEVGVVTADGQQAHQVEVVPVGVVSANRVNDARTELAPPGSVMWKFLAPPWKSSDSVLG